MITISKQRINYRVRTAARTHMPSGFGLVNMQLNSIECIQFLEIFSTILLLHRRLATYDSRKTVRIRFFFSFFFHLKLWNCRCANQKKREKTVSSEQWETERRWGKHKLVRILFARSMLLIPAIDKRQNTTTEWMQYIVLGTTTIRYTKAIIKFPKKC